MATLVEACWVCVGGLDIVNSERARVYSINDGGNGCGVGCGATWPNHLCSPTGETYTTAAGDDAANGSVWWLEGTQEGSEDIIGVVGRELSFVSGLKRGVGDANWGGVQGPLRRGPIEVQLSGTVFTRSRAGTAAAQAMLTPALMGSLCKTGCDTVDMAFYRACSCAGGPSMARVLKGAVLIPPVEISNDTLPRECGFRFVANFKTTNPYIYYADVLSVWETGFAGSCLDVCDVCPESSTSLCDCGCVPALPLPSRLTVSEGCFCKPFVTNRVCTNINPPSLWNDAALILKVESGSEQLRNLRLRAWPNPTGLPLPSPGSNSFKCQTPCVDIEVGCIPRRSTLTIDATTRTATIRCQDGTVSSAIQTLSSGGRGFRWPEIGGCTPLVMCVDTDGLNTAADARLTLGMQRRELS